MDNPEIIVAGSGKLARELLSELPPRCTSPVLAWPQPLRDKPAIVIHAGSGRTLDELVGYCATTRSVLLELATGSALENSATPFPLVLCPNTNILMLKAMAMIANSSALLRGQPIRVVESHQSAKTSVPGTAVSIAASLGVPAADIVSIRDPQVQQGELGIAAQDLARHAYHRIEIGDAATRLVIETRVVGDTPYADGVAGIVKAVQSHPLDNRLYHINEFIARGWL
ncbi:MAG: dihydrodipicolinate reductase [Rhodocyclales bacterium GT-UBC]|nr:MAG: dihydrodipicolinate reductase [Rhodocyclales bacterium GT-UBC]